MDVKIVSNAVAVPTTISTSFSENRSGGKILEGTASPTPLKTARCVVGDLSFENMAATCTAKGSVGVTNKIPLQMLLFFPFESFVVSLRHLPELVLLHFERFTSVFVAKYVDSTVFPDDVGALTTTDLPSSM